MTKMVAYYVSIVGSLLSSLPQGFLVTQSDTETKLPADRQRESSWG